MLRFKLFSLIFIGLCLINLSYGQNTIRLRSPRQTVETHLKFLSEEYQKKSNAWRYTMYSSYALNNPTITNEARKDIQQRAVMLQEIYEGLGEYIVFDEIPDNANYTDSTKYNKNVYYLTSRFGIDIYLEKTSNGNWYYSKETIENIPELYKKVFPLHLQKLFGLDITNAEKFLNLTSYQYIGIAVLLILALLLFKVFKLIINKILSRILKRTAENTEVFEGYLSQIAQPLSLAFLVIVLRVLVRSLQFPLEYSYYIQGSFSLAQIVFLTYVAYKLVNIVGAYMDTWANKTGSSLNPQLNVLLRKTARILIVLVGIWLFTEDIGWNITGVIAGLSLGGLAIALAAQDTLKNVFGSMMILVDKPFKIGDWIITEGIEGKVEDIGFRSTRIRTFYNSLITVSNAKIADMNIDNMGIREMIRYRTRIAITYDTPPILIDTYINGLRQIIDNHPYTHKENSYIFLHDFAASSLDILFVVHFITSDVLQEFAWRQETLLKAIHLAEHLGVRFAFPTSTLHIENMPEKQPLTSRKRLTKEEYQQKLNEFLGK
ncbi:MAG: mechanosensitive ion channel family protein [Cytophagales bacterium]|nr:MAG: mechanosensitive ion channel family protein [Cytophagales bacterium]